MNDFPSFDDDVTAPVTSTGTTPPAVPVQEKPAPAPRAPLTPKQKKRRIFRLIGVLVFAALIATGFIFTAIVNHSRTPVAQVRAYLTAISEGNASRANSLLDPGISNDDRDFLTNATMKNAEERIKILDVHELSTEEARQRSQEILSNIDPSPSQSIYLQTYIESDTAPVIEADYSLDGIKDHAFFVTHRGKNEYLVMHTWDILNSFIRPVKIHTKLPGVAIGDVDHALNNSGLVPVIYLYPGIYTITQSSTSPYLAGEEKITVGTEKISLELEAHHTDALKDLVLDTVKKQFDRCASTEGNLDIVCPYPVQNKDLAELSPVTAITTIKDFDGSIFTSGKGTIRIKPNPTSFDKDPQAKDIEFSFYGTVNFSAGEPEIKITSSREYW